MNILILSDFVPNYKESCGYRVRLKTAETLASKGNKVTCITPGNEKRLYPSMSKEGNQMMLIESPSILPKMLRNGGFDPFDAMYKIYHVLTNKYDVIQVTNGHRPANYLACAAGKYLKKAVVVDECWEWLGKGGHADLANSIFGKFKAKYDAIFEIPLKYIYDDIITISTTLQQRFNRYANTIVIHGGSEVDKLIAYTIGESRKKLDIDQEYFIIGMSNLTASDHQDNKRYFEAFSKLAASVENIRMIFTGSDNNYIRELIDYYRLDGKVLSPGWISFEDYNLYLSACNIFALPYPDTCINSARWPNKISDFMCLNRPILTNPTGDIGSLFNKYAIGFLCDNTSGDYVEMIKSIMAMSAIDVESSCADSAYLSRNVFSFDARMDKFLEIFSTRLKGLNKNNPI